MWAIINLETKEIESFVNSNIADMNKNHPCFFEITKFDFEVQENPIIVRHECNLLKYYLENGVVKEADIKLTPEYANWIDRKRQEEYTLKTDKLMYKFLEKQAASDIDGQKWIEEKAKIKEEIK